MKAHACITLIKVHQSGTALMPNKISSPLIIVVVIEATYIKQLREDWSC